ncbi:NAD-dependent epimerase/dehydratase family protein [Nitrobacteraceae bacterium UC4446_H13]
MTKDRILITGANGFIGRATVAAFLECGFSVNLAVRETSRLPWSADNDKLRIIVTGDLAAEDFTSRLDSAFANVRAIVHLAGLAHIATADRANADSLFFRANVASTRNLVDMALRHDVSSFIHLSSLAAVTPNTSTDIIDDCTTTPPSTGYGRSKLAAEAEVQKLVSAGIFAISLRPPLVTGAGARGNWAALQKLARTGLPLPFGSLQSKRSFASIETLTEAIVALCGKTQDHALSGNYCLADMEALSVADVVTALREGMAMSPRLIRCPTSLFSMIGAMTGRQRQLAGLIGPLEVNSARFRATFGFRPTLPLVAAIRRSGAAFVRQAGS